MSGEFWTRSFLERRPQRHIPARASRAPAKTPGKKPAIMAVAGKVLQWAATIELFDPEAGAHVGSFVFTTELVGELVGDDVPLGVDAELVAADELLRTQSEPWQV